MKKIIVLCLVSLSLFAGDIIVKSSENSVDETIEKIKNIVESKGMRVFDVIDHQANAKGVGMNLAQAKVIIFGNPKVGTLLMQEDIQVALDLPLKVLVYEDQDKAVKIAYRDGTWLKSHHFLQTENLVKKVNGGMEKITSNAAKKVK